MPGLSPKRVLAQDRRRNSEGFLQNQSGLGPFRGAPLAKSWHEPQVGSFLFRGCTPKRADLDVGALFISRGPWHSPEEKRCTQMNRLAGSLQGMSWTAPFKQALVVSFRESPV